MPLRKAALAQALGIASVNEEEKKKYEAVRAVQERRAAVAAPAASSADVQRRRSIADSVFADIGTPDLTDSMKSVKLYVDYADVLSKQLETARGRLSRDQEERSNYIDTLTAAPDPSVNAGDSGGHDLDRRVTASQAEVDRLEDQLTTAKRMQKISAMLAEDRANLEILARGTSSIFSVFTTGEFQNVRAAKKALLQKGYTQEELNELAEALSRDLNDTESFNRQQKAAREAAERPVAANLKALGASAVGGVTGTVDALLDVLKRNMTGSEYNTMDPYSPGYAPSDYAAAVRGQTAADIEKAVGNEGLGKTASAVYSGAASAADNLVRIGVGVLTGTAYASLGLAAASSFQDGVQSATQRGGTPAQALTYGVANAGLEVITEKIPLDQLFKTGTPQSWAQLAKNAAKQAGMEIVTEEANFLGGLMADAAILGQKSEVNTTINDLIASGMTYPEARAKAWEGLWWQAYETAVSSGISGGLLSGGASALGVVQDGGFPAAARPQTPETAAPVQDVPAPEAPAAPDDGGDRVSAAVDTMFDLFGIDRAGGEQAPAPGAVEETVDTVDAPVYHDPRAAAGAAGTTYSDANSPVDFHYAVVPVESLVVSHDEYGNANPAYPAALQPRDRTRVSSVTQIAAMSRTLNPELLAESPTAQNGSPIVRADGTVVSGNARTQAIRSAYKNAGADRYRDYITQNAARFGIDPAAVPENPVLVRVLDSDSGLEVLASSLNSSTTSGYSATERAMDDASRIGRIIAHLSPDDSGTLTSAGNRDFLRSFVSVTPAAQRGDLLQPDGSISKQGIERAKYAVFAYAYGDPGLMFALSEDTDADSRNLLAALVATAPAAVSVRDGAASGALHDVGAVSAVTNAVKLYAEVRGAGTSVEAYTAQQSMDAVYTPHEVFLAKVFEWNKRSAARMQAFLSEFYNQVRSYGDPDQSTMFSAAEPTVGGALKGATTGYEQSAGRQVYPGRDTDGLENAAGGRRDAAAQPVPPGGDSVEDSRSVPEYPGAGAADGAEAVGAASRDFSGLEAYNDLLTDDNVQPGRATDAKHEEVPIRDAAGRKVSEFAHNAMNSDVISERDVDALKHLIQEGAFGHDVQHMDDVRDTALKDIREKGLAGSVHAITKDIIAGKTDEHTIARAQVLFAAYSGRKGDHAQQMAAELLLDLSELSRQAGRSLNMFKLLRRMTPHGRLSAMKISVSRMTEQLNQGRSARNQVNPVIPPELEQAYVSAKTEAEQHEVVGKIQQAVADQLPSTLLEKWNALRYVNMLGNFKTQIRNVAGNMGMAAVTDLKNLIAASIESAEARAGGPLQRTRSAFVSRALLDKAKADFANVEEEALGAGKYADWEGASFTQGVQNKRRIFTSKNRSVDKLLKPLEAYRQATEWAMERGDAIFSKSAYAKALGGYLQANGVTAETFDSADPALMEKARRFAVKEAREATFRDDNALSAWVGKLGRKKTTPKAVRILSEGVMPFRKTPANVLIRAEEYSPLGLINTAVTAARAAKPGSDVTGADVINALSKSITGTGILLLGMGLRNLGILSGAEDEDENQAAFDDQTGRQPYSVTLPDGTSYTLDWFTPAALPLFMGAQLMDLIDDEGLELKDLESAFLSLADPMLEMSMLQGVNDTLDNIKYTDNNLGQFAINAMVSYLTQGLTNTLLGQIERSAEKERTTTYVDKDSRLPDWLQRSIGSALQKVPGVDFQQTPYVDAFGQTEDNGGLLYNLLSPGYLDKQALTDVQTELQRLADATGNTAILTHEAAKSFTSGGEETRLTAGQWTAAAKAQGQLAQSILAGVVSSEEYAALPDEYKVKAVETVYDYATDRSRLDTLGDAAPGFSAAWMKGISGREAETIVSRAVAASSGLTQAQHTRAREAGFSMEEMRAVSGSVAEYRENIESPDDYDTYRAVLKAADGDSTADWLRVYGMSESRLEAMQAAAKQRISASDYVDLMEAESDVDRAFSAVTEAWRNGEDIGTDDLAAAYRAFKTLPAASQGYAVSNASGRVRAYLKARNAGVSDAAFADLYKVYYNLDGKPAANATKWAVALDEAVAAGKISRTQRGILWDSLGFYAQVRQNADAYHKISGAGVSVGLAEDLTAVISGLKPETEGGSVRAIQKFEAITAFSGLSTGAEEALLKSYMTDSQAEKYDAMTSRGYSPDQWAAAYRAYLDGDKKADDVQGIMNALGISYSEALAVYKIYNGR